MRIASIADIKAHFSAYLRASQAGPVVVTRNGKPTAVLLNIVDEDELEGLLLAYSPKFQALLRAARDEMQATGGIPHEEFWRQVDAEHAEVPVPPKGRARSAGKPGNRREGTPPRGRTRPARVAVAE